MKGWFVLEVIVVQEEGGGKRRMRWSEGGRLGRGDEMISEAEEIGGGRRWMGLAMESGEVGIYLR